MFLKIGKAHYYANTPNGKIEGLKRDLGAKFIKIDGESLPLWSVAPKRVRILEYIMNNPNSAVTNICRTLHFSYPQEVNTTIAFFKDPERCHLIYEGPDFHRFSVLKEKEDEIRTFINDLRAGKIESSDLEEL